VSYLGSLGFVRNLKCQSAILECGYMSNTLDLNILLNDQEKIARGIFYALDKPSVEELKKKITLLQQLLSLYKQLKQLTI